MVRTLCSQCRGPGFNPCSGTQIPHITTLKTLYTAIKNRCSQINFFLNNSRFKNQCPLTFKMVLKCYNKATVPLKNLSCFSPYGNLTPPHWYSLSSSSRMAHFRKVLHKANSPTGGNTGEEAGRQAICRGTEGLRRSGRGQRGRAAP